MATTTTSSPRRRPAIVKTVPPSTGQDQETRPDKFWSLVTLGIFLAAAFVVGIGWWWSSVADYKAQQAVVAQSAPTYVVPAPAVAGPPVTIPAIDAGGSSQVWKIPPRMRVHAIYNEDEATVPYTLHCVREIGPNRYEDTPSCTDGQDSYFRLSNETGYPLHEGKWNPVPQ